MDPNLSCIDRNDSATVSQCQILMHRPWTALMLVMTTLAVACGGGGGGGGNGGGHNPPPLPPPLLGDLPSEVNYFDTLGHGNVTINIDFNLPDRNCRPSGIPGHYIVNWNPNLFLPYPSGVGEFFLRHEFGHAYLQQDLDPDPNQRKKEHLADAYGIRVTYQQYGAQSAQDAIQFFVISNAPPDATHPSHAARAYYAQQVLSAVQSAPQAVPTPPPTTGTLQVANPFQEPCWAIVNGTPLFVLALGYYGNSTLYGDYVTGDQYSVALVGYYSGGLYATGIVTLYGGHSVGFP